MRSTKVIHIVGCHAEGEAPVGLMVAGPAHADAHILDVGLSIEHILGTR